jgi:hypothetical protein
VLVVGSATFGFLPLAHAGTSVQTLAPTTEGWFQPNPSCAAPAGCVTTDALPAQPPVAVPTSPYPAGTLHVSAAAAQETSRSYLTFSVSLLDVRLTAATLDVPLDVAQADGSVSPEAAHVLVCTFSGSLTAAAGSLAAPPSAACTSSAPATYVATPAPHLHADLAPVLEELASGAGLVLLPDAAKAAPTDAPWHVVFSAHDRTDAAKTAPVSLGVTLEDLPQQQVQQPVVDTPPVDTGVPPLISGGIPLPTTELPQTPTVTGPAPTVPVASVPQARTVTVGYAYPTVWLLPLAFLLVVPLVARALTRDLTPVPTAP